MNEVTMTAERLSDLISRFGNARIAVLGDYFLDKYLDVDPGLGEPSVETGKTAHQVVNVRCSPGAAGTVVCNLHALGAGHLHAIGFSGDDGEGFDLRKQLTNLKCDTQHLHIASERFTPTYLKPRDANMAGLDAEHSRLDTKNRSRTPNAVEQQIINSVDALIENVDALVVLDQVDLENTGVVTQTVRETLSQRARSNSDVVFWADSRRRIEQFPRLTIKANQFEVVGIEYPKPEDEVATDELLDAARALREKNDAPIVLTQGHRGMIVSDPDWTAVPGVHIEGPIDPTGAGDSVTAGAVLALCAGATLAEAALIGNLVASITIQQVNTTGTATPNQLVDRLNTWKAQRS